MLKEICRVSGHALVGPKGDCQHGLWFEDCEACHEQAVRMIAEADKTNQIIKYN